MKILIDSRSATWHRGTGIGTYTYNIIKNIINLNNDNTYNLIWSGERDPDFSKENTRLLMSSKKHQRFFDYFYIPNYCIKENIDLYHIPQNGIGLSEKGDCLKIVTIHDLIPYILPETVGKGYLKRFLSEMPQILEEADGILTVSNYSKKDILRFFPNFPANRIFVTPLAANDSFIPLNKINCKNIVYNRFNFNNPFILYLGGFSLRKNVKLLIDSFNNIFKDLDSEYNLVIVGSLRDEGLKLKDYALSLPIKNNIIFTGFVEDDFLPIIYNACDLFVYPSLYEGFGLPPLEAMNCNTPVLTSNITSLPEVIKSSKSLINPNSTDLEDKLLYYLNNTKYRIELGQEGYLHSKNFSWKSTAINTLKAYEKLVSMGKKNP